MTDVGLRFELDNALAAEQADQPIVEDEPLTLESFEVVRQELGSLAVGVRHFIRADYTAPTSEQGFEAGLATGALMYQYGEPVTFASPRIDAALQPFAFADMPELLDLVEGRWPVRLPTPEDVDPTGLSDAEQQARQIGIYTRGQIEAVITRTVAERSGLERGSRLVLGNPRPDGTGALAVMVGRDCGAKEPGRPFCGRQPQLRRGRGRSPARSATIGFATLPEAYRQLRDVARCSYFYQTIPTPTRSAREPADVHRLQVLQTGCRRITPD